MAFPQVRASTYSTEPSDTTTHDVNLTGVASGDRAVLFAFLDVDSDTPTISGMPSGWSLRLSHNRSAGGGQRVEVWEKLDCSGSESSFSYTSATSQASHSLVWFVSGSATATPLEVSTAAEGTSSTPDPPSLTPSWGAVDSLFVAAYSVDTDRGVATVYPTSYTDNQTTGTNAGLGVVGVNFGVASRELNAGSDDPGTFTKSNADRWVTFTLAIPPATETAEGIIRAAETDTAQPVLSAAGTIFPEAPTGFTAVSPAAGQVDLDWNPVIDAEGRTVGYDVERQLLDGPGGSPVGDPTFVASGFTGSAMSDVNASIGSTYEYRVRAVIVPALRVSQVEESDEALGVSASADVTVTVSQVAELDHALPLSFTLVGGGVSGFGYNIAGASVPIPGGAVTATPSNLADLINSNPAGTSFALQAGTYNGTFPNKVNNKYYGNPSNPNAVRFNGNITFASLANGSAPTGGALVVMTGMSGNVWANLVIERYRCFNNNAGGPINLSGASGWRFQNVLFQDNWRAGMYYGGSGGEVAFCTSAYNGAYGYTGSGTDHVHRNNDSYHCGDTTVENRGVVSREDGGDRGGSKWSFTNRFMVRDSRWHNYDSNVQGVWFDIDNRNITIQDCLFDGIPRAAIHIELGHGPNIIRRNTLNGCGYVNRQWVYDASGILVSTGGPSEIYQNTVNGENVSKNGIILMQNNRDTAGDESAVLERWERWTELHGSAIYENTVRNIVEAWLGGTCLYTRPAQYADLHAGCNFVQQVGDCTWEDNVTTGADRFMWGQSAQGTSNYITPSAWTALGHS